VWQDEIFRQLELEGFLQRINCGPVISQDYAGYVFVTLVVRRLGVLEALLVDPLDLIVCNLRNTASPSASAI